MTDNIFEVKVMSKTAKKLQEYVESCKENTIIEMSSLYHEMFSDHSEMAFAKAVERMATEGAIVHLSKGLYYKPENSEFGMVPLSDEDIADYYMKDGHGIVIGYRLYNEKGITTQVSKSIVVLSDSLRSEQKKARNVKIIRTSVMLTPSTIPVLETLEILQNYSRIEDLNNKGLILYMERFASSYSDSAADDVLKNRKYKKSTIAFLKEFLDYLKVPNSLDKYLSKLSVYKVPGMEEIYENA